MRTFRLPALLLLLLVALPRLVGGEELIFLDGTTARGRVTAVTPGGEVVYGPEENRVDLQDLRRIRREVPSQQAPDRRPVVHLVDGWVRAKSVSLADGIFRLQWPEGREWQIPMRYVRGVRFPTEGEESESVARRFEDILVADLETDRALARTADKIRSVRCGVVALDARRLTVEYEGNQRRIPRERLVAIALAATAAEPDRSGQCRISTRDGSALWGRLEELAEGTLRLRPFPDLELKVPWEQVRSVEVRSDRMVFASDLDPASVQQGAIITYPWSHRRDRSVLGGPLRLDGTEYSRGLGTHAPCRLTYSVRGRYARFIALIGIDDSTGKRGDCLFRVYGDGQKLFEKRMRGTTDPETIRVDVSGLERVTLEVAPGRELDLADNANWCEARFIRSGPN